jgi:hypothetical protein
LRFIHAQGMRRQPSQVPEVLVPVPPSSTQLLKPDQVRPIMEVTKKIHDESENLETALRAYNAAMTVAQANEAMGKVQGSLALINTLLAEAYKADIEGEAAQQVLALLGNISMAIGETAKTVAQLQGGQ